MPSATALPPNPRCPQVADGGHTAAHLGAVFGIGSVDRNANFFELGGDSLVAIRVANTPPMKDWTLHRRTCTNTKPWLHSPRRWTPDTPGLGWRVT